MTFPLDIDDISLMYAANSYPERLCMPSVLSIPTMYVHVHEGCLSLVCMSAVYTCHLHCP